ncbi:MAG: hypothetical protein KGZ39_05060 [Simkania sp.]|nr:hypothetical protein [Simkania sp.]
MLQAVEKGKTTIYRRYIGERDGVESMVREEDEITSTILGPLEFFSPHETYKLWQHILNGVGFFKFLPSYPPESISIEFWPRQYIANSVKYIEPDAIIRMIWPNEVRILLIELKWHAPLNPKDQLHKQWLQFLGADEREHALHLFIAPDISSGIEAINYEGAGGNIWGNKLILMSWLQFQSILLKLTNTSYSISRWVILISKFLEKIGIRKFTGFRHVLNNITLNNSMNDNIFWHQFSWSRLINYPCLPEKTPTLVFYNS